MTRKKNKFFTFCFSLIPGAGEMYLGFMKQGISLMTLFCLIGSLSGFLNLPMLMCLTPIIWFYSFFHVNNLNSMPDEDFYALDDCYLIPFQNLLFRRSGLAGRRKKALAWGLIFIGFVMIYNHLSWLFLQLMEKMFPFSDETFWIFRHFFDGIPQMIVAIAIIYYGIYLIRVKKEDLYENQDQALIPSPPYSPDKETETKKET